MSNPTVHAPAPEAVRSRHAGNACARHREEHNLPRLQEGSARLIPRSENYSQRFLEASDNFSCAGGVYLSDIASVASYLRGASAPLFFGLCAGFLLLSQ